MAKPDVQVAIRDLEGNASDKVAQVMCSISRLRRVGFGYEDKFEFANFYEKMETTKYNAN